MSTFVLAVDKPVIRQVSSEGIRHSILICGKLTQLINEKNEVVWQVNENSRDGSVLPSGNILYSARNVAKEMTRDMKVVWRYALAKPNKELGTAWRLANGNTLVVERGPKPRLLEITKDGKVAVEVPLRPETDNGHMQTRMARKLANGNYLVPHLLAFKVKEYKPDGTVVNEIKTDLAELGGRAAENWPFTAIHLPNGNTVISSYAQRNPGKVRVFEVNRKKEVVWELFHPSSNAHGIHVISTNGKPLSDASLK